MQGKPHSSVNITDLYRLYVIEQKPMHQVADEIGISVGNVHRLIHENGFVIHRILPPKSEKEKIRISRLHKGKTLSIETKLKMSEAKKHIFAEGHTKKRCDGYIYVYYPTHPNCSKDGYVMEHRIVMEKHIGRLLEQEEVVHHINHNRADNRLENLQLLTIKEHASLHMRERHQRRNDLSIK